MKLFQSVLIFLILLVNLLFVSPSFAGQKQKANLADNPDYIEVNQAIEKLSVLKNTPTQEEGYNPEKIENQLAQLEFQKYTLESGITRSQCLNQTGKTLAVYGSNKKKSGSSYDSELYFLADGQQTKKKWDCDGFYIPNDLTATDLSVKGQNQQTASGVAIKIPDGTLAVISTNPATGAIEFNVPLAKVVKAGEVNWFIPNVSQAFLDTRVPNAPATKIAEKNRLIPEQNPQKDAVESKQTPKTEPQAQPQAQPQTQPQTQPQATAPRPGFYSKF
ncbi:hypothetical protein ACE1CD_02975 [Aerosakkonema sp. BLCC-F183]|uniref:hypothetical protein n=1 Tax=Aerosakkonema sp. BLCC-F183 TaxID=3342834 RepID=UPI0035B792B0